MNCRSSESQMYIVISSEPEAIRLRAGESAAAHTWSACPLEVRTSECFYISQSMTESSLDPDTSCLPSGEKVTQQTQFTNRIVPFLVRNLVRQKTPRWPRCGIDLSIDTVSVIDISHDWKLNDPHGSIAPDGMTCHFSSFRKTFRFQSRSFHRFLSKLGCDTWTDGMLRGMCSLLISQYRGLKHPCAGSG